MDFAALLACSCRRLPRRNALGLAVHVSQRPRVRRADREVRRGDVCRCQRVCPASCGSIFPARRSRAIVVLSRFVMMRKTNLLTHSFHQNIAIPRGLHNSNTNTHVSHAPVSFSGTAFLTCRWRLRTSVGGTSRIKNMGKTSVESSQSLMTSAINASQIAVAVQKI